MLLQLGHGYFCDRSDSLCFKSLYHLTLCSVRPWHQFWIVYEQTRVSSMKMANTGLVIPHLVARVQQYQAACFSQMSEVCVSANKHHTFCWLSMYCPDLLSHEVFWRCTSNPFTLFWLCPRSVACIGLFEGLVSKFTRLWAVPLCCVAWETGSPHFQAMWVYVTTIISASLSFVLWPLTCQPFRHFI
jgi:hypothetical protein